MKKIKNRRVRRNGGEEVGGGEEQKKQFFCLSPIPTKYNVVNIFKSIKSKF